MNNTAKIAELEQERDYWKEQAASKDERIDELELKYMEAGHVIEQLAAKCDSLADRLLSATREREQFRMMCGEIWPTVRMDGAFNNLAKAPEIRGMEGGLLMADNRTPVKKSPAKAKGDCTICTGWVDDGGGGTCVFTDDFWTPHCPYVKEAKR